MQVRWLSKELLVELKKNDNNPLVITSSVDSIVEQVTKKQEDKGEHCKGNQTVEKIDQIDFFHKLFFFFITV